MTFNNIQQFLKKWNQTVQELASVFDLQNTAYLSQKILENHWMTSVVALAVPAVLGSLVANYPNPSERFVGTQTDFIKKFFNQFLICKGAKKLSENRIQRLVKDLTFSKSEKPQVLETFWEELFETGGSGLNIHQYPGQYHRVYLKAIKVNKENQFALAEVKGGEYKIMRKQAFEKFIKEEVSFQTSSDTPELLIKKNS